MGIFDRLFGGKKQSEIFTNNDLVAAGACPNCWGTQSYDNEYRDYVKDRTKDNVNHDKRGQKAFIAQFVETHVTGIHLKRDQHKIVCKACNAVIHEDGR